MSDNLVQQLIKQHRNPDIACRYSFFPIQDEEMYKFYKKQEAAIWSSNEMDFSRDKKDYDELNPKLKRIIDYVNAFFSSTDGLIVDNILLRFLLESKSTEEQAYYITQTFIELVHSETYSLIINTLISDIDERNKLFESANTLDCVKNKINWLDDNMQSNKSLSHRLLVFACGEGIFFTSSFLFIFYFRSKGKFENIIFANEQISKDEGLHRDVGIFKHRREGKINTELAFDIVRKAVDLECLFVDELLPEPIDDLYPTDVKNYVKFLGDHLLVAADYPKLYNIKLDQLPAWMNDIAMDQKSNFYEIKVGNYKQSDLKSALDWNGRIEGKEHIINTAYADPLSIDF
uniref:ribonucleoside-diphosphate reductase n=1 Tax=Pithovirus LCPAC102 TaxID=2506587 RepID=A0A481Z2X6_9VIRU|nr:MAG: ribonucleoside diphosphate reductase, beta subunit [Pithovirus LCPAC102]